MVRINYLLSYAQLFIVGSKKNERQIHNNTYWHLRENMSSTPFLLIFRWLLSPQRDVQENIGMQLSMRKGFLQDSIFFAFRTNSNCALVGNSKRKDTTTPEIVTYGCSNQNSHSHSNFLFAFNFPWFFSSETMSLETVILVKEFGSRI